MPKRNDQNPTRAVGEHVHGGSKIQNQLPDHHSHTGQAFKCSSCGAEIPPKPGFRVSSIICPKCGKPAVGK